MLQCAQFARDLSGSRVSSLLHSPALPKPQRHSHTHAIRPGEISSCPSSSTGSSTATATSSPPASIGGDVERAKVRIRPIANPNRTMILLAIQSHWPHNIGHREKWYCKSSRELQSSSVAASAPGPSITYQFSATEVSQSAYIRNYKLTECNLEDHRTRLR
jgi:hypothetical protein